MSHNLDSKERKYQNLQSSVFGGGYVEQEPIQVDREAQRVKYATGADWKDEATKKIVNNGISRCDPFKSKQRELNSNIFEQTDYFEYLPLSKATSEAILSKAKVSTQKKTYGLKQSNDLHLKKEKSETSCDDTISRSTANLVRESPKISNNMEERNLKVVKQQMLASTNFETGKNSMDYYTKV